jgi:hypothetical protein
MLYCVVAVAFVVGFFVGVMARGFAQAAAEPGEGFEVEAGMVPEDDQEPATTPRIPVIAVSHIAELAPADRAETLEARELECVWDGVERRKAPRITFN